MSVTLLFVFFNFLVALLLFEEVRILQIRNACLVNDGVLATHWCAAFFQQNRNLSVSRIGREKSPDC